MKQQKYLAIGIALFPVLAVVLTGCVGYVEGPGRGVVHAHPAEVVVQNDYVYYPGYEVYYSGTRREYVYLDGRSWVSRPAPPHVSLDVLFASPSVRLDFHDSPSFHHTAVVRQYPRHWAPPGSPQGGKGGQRGRD